MAFFKRIEVWVLLALTVAGVIAVLRMDKAGERGSRPDGSGQAGTSQDGGGSTAAAQARHRIESLALERDGDHAVLEIRVRVRADSKSGEPPVTPPKVRLLRADGSEVPPFFVPFRSVSVEQGAFDDEGGAPMRLLFWADQAALAGALDLEVDGERIAVKDADGFELESVDDGKRAALSIEGGNRGAGAAADGGAS